MRVENQTKTRVSEKTQVYAQIPRLKLPFKNSISGLSLSLSSSCKALGVHKKRKVLSGRNCCEHRNLIFWTWGEGGGEGGLRRSQAKPEFVILLGLKQPWNPSDWEQTEIQNIRLSKQILLENYDESQWWQCTFSSSAENHFILEIDAVRSPRILNPLRSEQGGFLMFSAQQSVRLRLESAKLAARRI
jgi:hypothetical protein